jgi:LPS sulfotransferase NodH
LGKKPFDSFVVLAGMRTGSNFLEANLNALAGVVCHGEVFNPSFIGKKNQTELFGITMAAREADPMAMLRKLRDMTPGLSGFRFFHDHDPRILAAVLEDKTCAKIILTRNPLESYVSLQIVRETGQWKLGDGKALKTAKVRFEPRGFEAHLDKMQGFLDTVRGALQQSGQAAFHLDYDDLQDVAVLNGLARYLGVDAQLTAPDTALKKQNPDGLPDKVTNPAEMEAALARLDLFGLGNVPAFEPRRSAGIPGFVASDDAGLLYMPMRSGHDALVTDWLAGCGAISGEFNQKTLRQWKRARPGHRSFTVLRHPLLRAYSAFADKVLTDDLPELRGLLARSYKVELPSVGAAFADADAHRAAFVGFLRFLKLNLSGQTGFRVVAQWASQTAVLQGFAQFQGPDHVLREDRLAQGLQFLADEVGVTCPPLPAAGTPTLASIYDTDLEAAARDAYARDYVGFGFGNWQP